MEIVMKLKFLVAILMIAGLAARAEDAKPAAPASGAAEVKLGDVTKGKEIFEGRAVPAANCTLCHGIAGKGDGIAGAALPPPKPRNFTDKVEMDKITNAEMVKAITEGGAAIGKSIFMTPWKGILNDEQIKDVAAYIRTFAK
jgi:mono/diheme cytochrome c family protein